MSQVRPINFSGILSNTGSSDLTNCFLEVEVSVSAAVVFSDHSDSTDIASMMTDSIGISEAFVPSTYGVYQVKLWVNSDSIDLNPINDTIEFQFEVTSFYFSRSNSQFSGMYSLPSDSIATVTSWQVGNIMESSDEICIAGIRVFVPDTSVNIGQYLTGSLWVYDTTISMWDFYNDFDGVYLESTDLGGYVNLYADFAMGTELLSNTIFAPTLMTVGDGSVFLHYATNQKIDEETVLF